MERTAPLLNANFRMARVLWGAISPVGLRCLKELTREHRLSIAPGDLLNLEGSWYVTHTGLLHIAQCRRCSGIATVVQKDLCDSLSRRWVFKATVYTSSHARFVGYGDADPSNVSPLVRGAEMRVAETRAVNRALQGFDCAPWVHKAKALPREEFKREVEKHLTGKETEPWEILYFKAYKSQLPVIEQALETAALMLGSDKSRGYCLEMICADFLAGVSLETGNQDALLSALTRLVLGLPKPQREQLLESVQVAP